MEPELAGRGSKVTTDPANGQLSTARVQRVPETNATTGAAATRDIRSTLHHAADHTAPVGSRDRSQRDHTGGQSRPPIRCDGPNKRPSTAGSAVPEVRNDREVRLHLQLLGPQTHQPTHENDLEKAEHRLAGQHRTSPEGHRQGYDQALQGGRRHLRRQGQALLLPRAPLTQRVGAGRRLRQREQAARIHRDTRGV